MYARLGSACVIIYNKQTFILFSLICNNDCKKHNVNKKTIKQIAADVGKHIRCQCVRLLASCYTYVNMKNCLRLKIQWARRRLFHLQTTVEGIDNKYESISCLSLRLLQWRVGLFESWKQLARCRHEGFRSRGGKPCFQKLLYDKSIL